MKKWFVLLFILILLVISTEADMATKNLPKQDQNVKGNKNAGMPAWLGGGGGGKDDRPLAPTTNKNNRPLAPSVQPKNIRGVEDDENQFQDAIMNALIGGAASNPVLAGGAGGAALPAWMQPVKDNRGMMPIGFRDNRGMGMMDIKDNRGMGMMAGGAIEDDGGFSTQYVGNWRRGGGGGYGYGGYSNSPAWMNYYQRLNNWNIG